MEKFKNLSRVKGLLQIVGIVVSAVISALTAAGVGGDPVQGAAIGVGVNSIISAI